MNPFLRVSLITYLSHIAICFYARTIANRHEIKVVSAYHILSAGLIGAWLKKNLGIPLVTTIFGEVYREEQLYRKLEKLVKLAVSSSDVLVSCSDHCARSLVKIGFHQPVQAVLYGVDTEQFKPDNTGAVVRASLAISDEAVVVGFVGRMVEEMGLHIVLQIARRMLEADTSVHFLIAGTAGILTEEALALQRGYPSQVHVMVNVAADLLPNCYAAVDLVLVPSINERACLGLAIAEGMASGKTVIASRVGGHPEVIRDETMGILVTPNSAADMQIALEELLADKTGLREQMGRAARLAALEHFDVRDTTRRMENIFSALL